MQINIRPVPAPALTGLQATPGLKQVALSWTIPPDPTYRASLIYSSTSTNPDTAVLVATVTGNTYTVLTDDATAKNYWVRSKNIYERVDGAWSNGVSGSGRLIQSSDIALGAVDLSKHVTGYLSSGQVDGLGALATLSTVDANTHINNLGNLAFADRIAANEIGAGTLAAGVVYAGSIEANNITSGTLTSASINIPASGGGSAFSVGFMGNTVGYRFLEGYNIDCTNGANGGAPALTAASYSYGSTPAIYASGGIESRQGALYSDDVLPNTDGAYSLGLPSLRWGAIRSTTAVEVSSDQRKKCEIEVSDLGLDFLNTLRPVSYKMIEGRKEVTLGPEPMGPWAPGTYPKREEIVTSIPGVRRHYGLIAQEVKAALGDRDAAMWVIEDVNDPESAQSLRYEELISPLIKAVQELHALVKAQQAEIDALKAAL